MPASFDLALPRILKTFIYLSLMMCLYGLLVLHKLNQDLSTKENNRNNRVFLKT